MKAIVQNIYGPPEVLQLEDIRTPDVGVNDILVRVRAAGVDAGVWHLMSGRPFLLRLFGFGLRKPKVRVRGLDVAGTVEAVGANVVRFRPGDEVYGTSLQGTYAQYTRTTEDKLAPKPSNLSFEQAAAVPVSACAALHGLRDAGQLQPGQKVLVIGAGGGVGSFAVQLAKVFGAEVTGVCSAAKTDLVRSVGADHVIDYAIADFANGTELYDLILDTAGNNSLSRLRRALTRRGTLVIVGGEGGGRWLGGFDRQLRALLVSMVVSQKIHGLVSAERPEDLEDLRALIESGQVTPAIDRMYPLEEVPDAIKYQHEGTTRGKLVIRI
ncbi:NAD(P)-dependent alcohol dehydrogenase [Pseudarthrobacter sp. N5]|uniref:NAD(P)-dependent alcohol dehydrogenase n=1 Tax=Pseudarthrobacter sp. N5 TaxID=3418416 RepID=UPI003CE6D58D